MFQDGSPISSPPFILEIAVENQNGDNDKLRVSTIDQSDQGIYKLKYVVQSSLYPDSQYQELDFEIEIVPGTSCVKRWRFPPYSFDSIYIKGDDELTIEFDEVDITNCPFELEVFNITDSDMKPLNPRIAKLEPPKLVRDSTDSSLVTVADYARLII